MYISTLRDGQLLSGDSPSPGNWEPARPVQQATSVWRPRLSTRAVTLAGIALAHFALFASLVLFDVIQIAHKKPPLQVVMVPVEITPPPKPPEAKAAKVKVVETPIMAPPPIVETPVLAPPPVVVTPDPVPPAPPVVKAAAVADTGQVGTPGPMSIGKLSVVPGNPPLKYPMTARIRHEEGVVRLRILVDTDGHVADISLAQSSGFDALDKAAMEVVRRWKFVPPTRDGVPVQGIGIFPASFKLA
jgi:protein TonB